MSILIFVTQLSEGYNMKNAVLEIVVDATIKANILVLNAETVVSDFVTIYNQDKNTSFSLIESIEENVVPAKVFKLANEELVKVKGFVVSSSLYPKVDDTSQTNPYILLISQKEQQLRYDLAIIHETISATDFITKYKEDKHNATAKYVLACHYDVLGTVEETKNLCVLQRVTDWVIVAEERKKKKKVSNKEIEFQLQNTEPEEIYE